MAEPRLETTHLKLVPLAARWNDDIFRLLNEPEVANWLFLTGPPTREQVEARTKIYEQFWAERGHGLFAVVEKTTDRFVARVGALETPDTGRTEIAWTTTREAWGRGYASEAAKAAIDFTFAHSKLDELDCYLRPDNVASRRVAEKVGFRYQDTRFLYERVLRYYRLRRL